MRHRIIAWDFDGVLNLNKVDGVLIWKQNFERDIGRSESEFSEFVFRSGRFSEALVGKLDVRDLVAEWVVLSGCLKSADEILNYWFDKDARPDPRTLALLQRSRQTGFVNVLATNNEARRAHYIEHEMGMAQHLDRIFAAGPMGSKKPDPRFFKTIQGALGAPASDFLLIDDAIENTEAARAQGWSAFQFEPGDYDGLEEALFG